MNEILFFVSVLFYMSLALFTHYLFGRLGLYIWTALAVVLANIEVLKLVEMFGMQVTLGNALFGTTMLVTDLLSEKYGRKEARLAVYIGFSSAILFVLISQLWLLFIPSADDFVNPSFMTIFSMSPRIVLVSMVTYFITQHIDIVLYHKIWDVTAAKYGKKRFLWLRNNGCRLVTQAINSIMFNIGAFYGVFSNDILAEIIVVNFLVFMAISLLDTPFAYFGRSIKGGVLAKSIGGLNE